MALAVTNISSGPVDESGQIVSFTITNDNIALFSVQPAIDPSGTLTFTPAANFNGVATVTVLAVDKGDNLNSGTNTSTPQTFRIVVMPVNDAPSVTLAASLVGVLEDSGSYTGGASFASFSPGPADEAGQTVLSYTVSNNNSPLFSVQPAIDASGTLTFTPVTNGNGVATITVIAQDSGGTANGGVDRATNTFTITVTSVNDAPTFALPGWSTWTPRESHRSWSAIASSADGSKLVALDSGSVIYTSKDAGVTWAPQPAAGVNAWNAVASSADGTKLVATANGGQIYTSTDSGTNWVARESNREWRCVACSADGSTLVAGVENGQLFTSTDSGQTWTARESSRIWLGVACSADGAKMVAVAIYDRIYTSTDSGQTWTSRTGQKAWRPVASSADGTKLVAAEQGGRIYTSTDSGLTWTARADNRDWYFLSSSADGTKLDAVADNDKIYVSADSGVTWAPRENNRVWRGITSSADGSKLAAIAPGDQIFTATDALAVSVLEDSGPYAQAESLTGISAGPADESGQSVSFTVANNNNALFSAQPAIAMDGTMTFTPAANASGVATVTVVAQDDGTADNGGVSSSAAQTFTITVTAVNDAPVITFSTNTLFVTEDSGPSTFVAFATFNPFESGQSLTNIATTNTNPALFSVQPYFTADGTLRFTPVPDTTGTGIVTVVVQDNGGTANSGVDAATNIFTLIVSPVNTPPSFTLTNFPAIDGVQNWLRDATSVAGVGRKVVTDGSGNVIVAGDYAAPGGEVSQRDLIVIKYQPDGTPVWTNTVDASFLYDDRLEALVVDSSENVVLLGSFNNGTTNFVTVRYQANGTPAWTNVFDSGFEDAPAAMAVDAGGNVFVTGAVTDPASQNGYSDYVTIKYAPNGQTLWMNTNAFSTVGSDQPRAIAVDSNGDAVVTGIGSDTDYQYAMTVKISGSTGTNIWSRFFSTENNNNNSHGAAVTIDGTDSVFVAADLLESGISKIAVVKYSNAGTAAWTNTFTRSGADAFPRGLVVDSAGNAIVTGVTYNGTDTDFTTIKFDGSTGIAIWTNHLDGSGGEDPSAIAVNSAGEVFVTGHSIGGQQTGKDYLTVKYTAAGAGVWTNRYDSVGSISADDAAQSLAVDANGNVYVTGEADTVIRTIKYAYTPSPGASQTFSTAAGAVSVSGFVTASSVGPANESAQTLSFIVTNDNPGLFTVQPTISPAGVLSYTVAAGVSGLAVVTVRAQDTGGTDNGGTDTSASQSFNITIMSGKSAAFYVWLGGTGDWNDPAKWTPRGVPGVEDSASIPSGSTVQLTNMVTVAHLTQDGGTLGGTGSLTIRSSMNWNGGVMSGAGTTTIANGATLAISGGVEKNLNRRLDNYGAVTWTDARITGDSAPVINNFAGATFHIQTDTTLFESYSGGARTFNNSGTLLKTVATGNSVIQGTFNQSGKVDTRTGIINPIDTINLSTANFSGAGRFLINQGALTLGGTVTVAGGANLEFAGGTLTGTGRLIGTFNWTGGTMSGPGTTTIATNGALLISGSAQKSLNRQLDNYGIVTWTGARITGDFSPVINNYSGALFDIQTDTTLYESYSGGARTFNNSGTLRKSAGTGTTAISGAVNNASLVNAQTGTIAMAGGGVSTGVFTNADSAATSFTTGTHTLGSGVRFTGAGTGRVDGGVVNVGTGVVATVDGTVEIAGGTLGGDGDLTVLASRTLVWTGGIMSGTGKTVIETNATLTVSGAVEKNLNRRLDNYGTATWTGARITGDSGPIFNNFASGLFHIQTDATLFESYSGGSRTLNNNGTVRKSVATGTSVIQGTFYQTGTVDTQTGTINPQQTINLGTASFGGAGRFLVNQGALSLNGTITVDSGANFEFAGGTLTGTGTVVGTLSWTGGVMTGPGTTSISANGVLAISGAAEKNLNRQLDNYGRVTWSGARITGDSAPIINNFSGAFFDIQTDSTLFESYSGGALTFNNSGTVRKFDTTGTTTIHGNFSNSSLLIIRSGIVSLSGGYAPSSTSSLRVFIGGLTAGTQFGQLQVSGATVLAGGLDIELTNSFVPAEGNNFVVVNATSRLGAFSSVTGANFGGSVAFDTTYLPTGVTLAAVPVLALPPLSPQAFGAERSLRWPGGFVGYELQTATTLGPNAEWTPVRAPVELEGGDSIVRLPDAGGIRFYRLVRTAVPRPESNQTQ